MHRRVNIVVVALVCILGQRGHLAVLEIDSEGLIVDCLVGVAVNIVRQDNLSIVCDVSVRVECRVACREHKPPLRSLVVELQPIVNVVISRIRINDCILVSINDFDGLGATEIAAIGIKIGL